MDPDFDSDINGQNDKVEITLKGSASAIGELLTGKTIAAIESKFAAEADAERERQAREREESKHWKTQDELHDAKRQAANNADEVQRLTNLVRIRNETITGHERTINDLRAKVAELEGKHLVELTPDMQAKLAEERERAFQRIKDSIAFPKQVPHTFVELMNLYVFPLFEAGRAPSGWSVGQPAFNAEGTACGNKIAMIKQVRELTGAGLKEAKEFIEGTTRLR